MEISRLWRGFANSTSGEQAPRPPSCECEVDSMSKLIEPPLIKLHKYDAHWCIIFMERYRSGHNGADSKGSRAYHSATCENSCFLRLSRKCFIFLEFWMNAFHHRPCKSRAKFKLNLIRRDIEVVITGLTRNQFALTRTRVRIPLSPPNAASAAKRSRRT